MSTAWKAFKRYFEEGDNDIAGIKFLSGEPSEEAKQTMATWSDPRGADYGKPDSPTHESQRPNWSLQKFSIELPFSRRRIGAWTFIGFAFLLGFFLGL